MSTAIPMQPEPTMTAREREAVDMTSIQPLLVRLDACQAARTWAGDRDLATAWRDCPRGDWLLWLASRLGVDRRLVVRAACACARTSLPLIPAGEERPRLAIEAAEAWARGEATIGEVRDAAYAAAYVAAADAATASSSSAAYAASVAYAAASSSAASSSAAAAYAAARAGAAYAYAYDAASLAHLAELVRAIVPVDAILAGVVIAE